LIVSGLWAEGTRLLISLAFFVCAAAAADTGEFSAVENLALAVKIDDCGHYARNVPYVFYEQAIESIPQIHPDHVLLAAKRLGRIGRVDYSLVSYLPTRRAAQARIEGMAGSVEGMRAWCFSTEAPAVYHAQALMAVLEQVAALPSAPPSSLSSAKDEFPREVRIFIENRDTCDHFRGEPFEGDTPEQKERRAFILGQLQQYCTGTDKRLAGLRQKYRHRREIMELLSRYEGHVEGD
jgi:hypothetical protein